MKTYTMNITKSAGSTVMRMEVPKTQHERLKYEHSFERRQNYLDAEAEVKERYGRLVTNW